MEQIFEKVRCGDVAENLIYINKNTENSSNSNSLNSNSLDSKNATQKQKADIPNIPADQFIRNVDVISVHYKDGQVVPLRIRVEDEDGEEHTYSIKDYKDLSGRGAYTTSDGIYVTDRILHFECRIVVLGQIRRLRLYYHRNTEIWTIRFG
jgi:hypothetical protein